MAQSKQSNSSKNFQSFGFNEKLLQGIINMNYRRPTPVQRESIPLLMKEHDVLALARTGSGKTAAFMLPMMHILHAHSEIVGIRGVVVSPTRELALQTCRFGKSLGRFIDLRFCLIVGGNSLEEQFCALTKNPDVLICTPGRLLQVMEESNLELKRVRMIVFDEGDRLFEQGFQPQVSEILKCVPEKCTRALFSATLPKSLADFALAGLRKPILVKPDAENTLPDSLCLSFFFIRTDQRLAMILYIMNEVIKLERKGEGVESIYSRQAAIFVPTRYHVELYETFLTAEGISCSPLHGSMDQEARKIALNDFRNRTTQVLVVTDVAARGIDLPELEYVINAFAPHSEKLFVHRVGRVARAGKSGTAISFLEITDMPFLSQLTQTTARDFSCDPCEEENVFQSTRRAFYGTVPSIAIQNYVDRTIELFSDSPELESLQRTADNGIKQYKKLINPPSKEIVEAAKKLSTTIKVHPCFHHLSTAETTAFKVGISNYRSSGALQLHKDSAQVQRSIKETKDLKRFDKFVEKIACGDKPSAAQQSAPQSGGSLASKLSRRVREKGPMVTVPTDSWLSSRKDSEYFLSYNPTKDVSTKEEIRGAQDIASATMELQAETSQDLATVRKRTVYSWDDKKRKYVKTSHATAQLKMQGMKNEAGKKLGKIQSRNLYGRWCAQNSIDIQKTGERESEKHVHFRPQFFSSKTKKGKRLSGKLLEKHVDEQQKRKGIRDAQKRRFLNRN